MTPVVLAELVAGWCCHRLRWGKTVGAASCGVGIKSCVLDTLSLNFSVRNERGDEERQVEAGPQG